MKFKGDNKTPSTIELVSERIKYKLTPEHLSNNVVDFNFSERVYFGRINPDFNAIYPNQESIVNVNSSYDGITVFQLVNFVADALSSFLSKMDQAKLYNKITKNSFMADLKVHKAYEDPEQLYFSFANEYLLEFNNTVDASKIQKYEDWISEMLKWHSNNGPNFPITFSGFQKSKRSNMFTSGLCVSFSNESIADDSTKEKYLNDKQYGFYLNAAKQYGFNVNQNAPWILTADLNSPALSLYLKKYNLSTEQLIFSRNFSLCYERDLELLGNVLSYNWNLFVNNNKKLSIIDTTCINTRVSYIYLNNNINNNEIYNIINYINIRNTEEYKGYGKPELDRIIKKSIFFYKKFDISRSMGYINEQFRILTKERPGTLNNMTNNINRRNNDISNY